MIKVTIFSGFLGAGKTTLIRKLLSEVYNSERVVLIENEFGTVSIDSEFLRSTNVEIRDISSGCICCSLVGDFKDAIIEIAEKYSPDRILIEPSGVAKLSDIINSIKDLSERIRLDGTLTIVDGKKYDLYIKNYKEFYADQIANADCVMLSHTDECNEEKMNDLTHKIRKLNEHASLITTPITLLSGQQITDALSENIIPKAHLANHTGHDDGHDCCEHKNEQEHHHEHIHEHHHHGHAHADDKFSSWGTETPKSYGKEQLNNILNSLNDRNKFGVVLRAKGFVSGQEGKWIYFDYTPDIIDIRFGEPCIIGKISVIGSDIDKAALKEAFYLK